ncbi:type II toxin-antitoxin system RelE family toxin [Yokenella regensburgei]|uniref:type II toxin-antitoxin system RelE family toxin n=1 Tax=Yokenella regensburgei TaxID=158877 RepID=UPI00289741E0|nr:type II toxin-antitoxin system RelE/ParE family toxin [Yokenella regensburgei]
MTYKLAFHKSALKEWKKLGHTLQKQFKKKLRDRLENPEFRQHNSMGAWLSIILTCVTHGYHLVYRVDRRHCYSNRYRCGQARKRRRL